MSTPRPPRRSASISCSSPAGALSSTASWYPRAPRRSLFRSRRRSASSPSTFQPAPIASRSASAPPTSVLSPARSPPPPSSLRSLTLGGEPRRWLYMHPPTEAAVRLRVPPHAYFQAGLALDPETWFTETGDGVRFIVEAETAEGRRSLLDQRVNPRANAADRR